MKAKKKKSLKSEKLTMNAPVLAQSETDKLLQEGHKLNRAGDLDGAIEFYKKSLEADPEHNAAKRFNEKI